MLNESQPWSLNSVLGALDASFKQAVDWQEWGLDSRLIRSLQLSLDNPSIQEAERLERASNSFLQLFVTMFVNSIARSSDTDAVERITFSGEGSIINLWIYLKPDKWDFYNKNRFYSAVNHVASVPLFKNHSVDFRIMKGGVPATLGGSTSLCL